MFYVRFDTTKVVNNESNKMTSLILNYDNCQVKNCFSKYNFTSKKYLQNEKIH